MRLHHQATTTPKIRYDLYTIRELALTLSKCYGITKLNITKLKNLDNVDDQIY